MPGAGSHMAAGAPVPDAGPHLVVGRSVPDPAPRMAVDFLNETDWYDSDQAAFELAVALGAMPQDSFTRNKWVFWTDNPVGNGLHQALLALAAGGLIEYDEDADRFRRFVA